MLAFTIFGTGGIVAILILALIIFRTRLRRPPRIAQVA